MDGTTTHIFGLSPLPVAVIGIVLAIAVLLTYHCIVAHWCSPRESSSSTSQRWMVSPGSVNSSDDSITNLIPSFHYTKDIGLVNATCVVCLCEFKDGEAIRILPKCLHSFHVPCIDMWLCSHSNCPLCRTTVISSGHVLGHRPEYHTVRLPDSSRHGKQCDMVGIMVGDEAFVN
ncbi:RING-H2 finger protein ATL51 [Vitis vinifera]|uniref:RING-type E3 ubiquitin transferase n=1 Tax=Vitis vinifera TaxID=29760 RepID=A0A438JXW9_VITVI|nr:RING-H2 finger protein ATL51 [Vitis vinifera]